MTKGQFQLRTLKSKCNCSKPELILEAPFPLKTELLQALIPRGYKNTQTYINSGILMLIKGNLIAMGSVGSNKINIKCKKTNCSEELEELQAVLEDFYNESKNKSSKTENP